jgi:hypothetical protein
VDSTKKVILDGVLEKTTSCKAVGNHGQSIFTATTEVQDVGFTVCGISRIYIQISLPLWHHLSVLHQSLRGQIHIPHKESNPSQKPLLLCSSYYSFVLMETVESHSSLQRKINCSVHGPKLKSVLTGKMH